MAQSPPGGRVLSDVRGAVNQTWRRVTELKWFLVLNILMRKPTDACQNGANIRFLSIFCSFLILWVMWAEFIEAGTHLDA